MNWAKLSKEAKQKAILGAVLGGGVLFAALRFGASPLIAAHAARVEEARQLRGKIDEAAKAIRNERDLDVARAEASAKLSVACSEHVPPIENPLSWATQFIYGHGRAVGINIESISEVDARTGLWESKEQAKRSFKPYSVRVLAQCSYSQLLQLLASMERSSPQLCITDMSITGRPGHPQAHQVSLIVEWPTWMKPGSVPAACAKQEKKRE